MYRPAINMVFTDALTHGIVEHTDKPICTTHTNPLSDWYIPPIPVLYQRTTCTERYTTVQRALVRSLCSSNQERNLAIWAVYHPYRSSILWRQAHPESSYLTKAWLSLWSSNQERKQKWCIIHNLLTLVPILRWIFKASIKDSKEVFLP